MESNDWFERILERKMDKTYTIFVIVIREIFKPALFIMSYVQRLIAVPFRYWDFWKRTRLCPVWNGWFRKWKCVSFIDMLSLKSFKKKQKNKSTTTALVGIWSKLKWEFVMEIINIQVSWVLIVIEAKGVKNNLYRWKVKWEGKRAKYMAGRIPPFEVRW